MITLITLTITKQWRNLNENKPYSSHDFAFKQPLTLASDNALLSGFFNSVLSPS